MPAAAAAAKSLQLCPTLCDPIDGSPPGSAVPGILQTRTLEWVAISFSSAWKWKVKVKLLSRVWLLVTPWTAAYQAPLSMGFSRQEYWSGVPLPSPLKYLRYPEKMINVSEAAYKPCFLAQNFHFKSFLTLGHMCVYFVSKINEVSWRHELFFSRSRASIVS